MEQLSFKFCVLHIQRMNLIDHIPVWSQMWNQNVYFSDLLELSIIDINLCSMKFYDGPYAALRGCAINMQMWNIQFYHCSNLFVYTDDHHNDIVGTMMITTVVDIFPCSRYRSSKGKPFARVHYFALILVNIFCKEAE